MSVRWEEMLDRSVESLRREFGISPGGKLSLKSASASFEQL
jgi:hypothetical protein